MRQLFYRLVAAQELPNTNSAYKTLSSKTAEARRTRSFPDLIDRGRKIHRRQSWSSPTEILTAARNGYRRDRTEGQDVSLYIGVEKAGMVVQLEAWFGDMGIPILALGGYSSQTYIKDIADDVSEFDRPAVLLYGGDFDSSGEDIDRDFVDRGDCWAQVVRVALTNEQVQEYELPINEGKETDSRSAAFVARHGSLMQVELDALPPETLRALFQAALDEFWDPDAYETVLEREANERKHLSKAVAAAGKGRG
ncbi:MAG: hypothetical protein ABIP94_00070 [Planctomycetota bacterium]